MSCQLTIAKIETINQFYGATFLPPSADNSMLCQQNYQIVKDYLTGGGDWATFVQQQNMGECEEIAKEVGRVFGLPVCFGVLKVDHEFWIDHTLDDDYNPDDPDYEMPVDEEPTKELWHYWNLSPTGQILDFAKGTVRDLIDNLDLDSPFPDTNSRYELESVDEQYQTDYLSNLMKMTKKK